MKKTLLVSALIPALLMAACSFQPATDQQTGANYIYKHQAFSLTLPTAFTVDEDAIIPENEGAFPVIDYFIDSEKKTLAKKDLIAWEDETNKSMCAETENCGKITGQQDVNIDGIEGIKLLIQYQGRDLEDKKGFTNEYAYAFINNYRFWATVTDQENPKDAEKKFDEIMKTIKFVK